MKSRVICHLGCYINHFLYAFLYAKSRILAHKFDLRNSDGTDLLRDGNERKNLYVVQGLIKHNGVHASDMRLTLSFNAKPYSVIRYVLARIVNQQKYDLSLWFSA